MNFYFCIERIQIKSFSRTHSSTVLIIMYQLILNDFNKNVHTDYHRVMPRGDCLDRDIEHVFGLS